jgi:hypothetical protein
MSWDIFVQHLPIEAKTIAEIPDDYDPPAIGPRLEVIEKIRNEFPSADFSDPSWGIIDGPNYSMEVSLGNRHRISGFVLHVRGEDPAVAAVQKILTVLDLRGIDSSTGEIFSEETAVESLRRWRRYRDRVVEGA